MALEAYIAAINRLDNAEYKRQFESFSRDHERHIQELSGILKKHGITPPADPTLKSILTQGKVVIGNMINDKAILAAMGTNEEDTNTAYDRLNHYKDIPADEKKILEQAYEDEKHHRAWILQTLK